MSRGALSLRCSNMFKQGSSTCNCSAPLLRSTTNVRRKSCAASVTWSWAQLLRILWLQHVGFTATWWNVSVIFLTCLCMSAWRIRNSESSLSLLGLTSVARVSGEQAAKAANIAAKKIASFDNFWIWTEDDWGTLPIFTHLYLLSCRIKTQQIEPH